MFQEPKSSVFWLPTVGGLSYSRGSMCWWSGSGGVLVSIKTIQECVSDCYLDPSGRNHSPLTLFYG